MMKAVASKNIQFVSDESGVPTGVIVPIEEWRRMEAERAQATPVRQILEMHKGLRQSKSLDQLAAEQGIKPLADPKILQGVFEANEDIDEILDEIYRGRR